MILTIILVVAIFSLLVFIHEAGHFVAARRNGVEVEEFGFGFPPRAIGKQVGRTIYSINWLPLGGFVRMKGEDGADTSPGSFGAASTWKRSKILLAGVMMNAILAYLIVLLVCAIGLPSAITAGLTNTKPSRVTPAKILIVEVSPNSPAAQAGLKQGDSVRSADGKILTSEQQLTDFTHSHADQTVDFEFERSGKLDKASVKLNNAEIGKKSGFLGVTPYATSNNYYGWRTPLVAAEITGRMLWLTLTGIIGALVGLVIHHGGSATQAVTGPIGIVVLLKNVMYLGLNYTLFFVATISASLAVLNTLPIPALDGGRLFLMLLPKVTGRKISPQTEATIHSVAFIILILLMGLITVFDVKRFL